MFSEDFRLVRRSEPGSTRTRTEIALLARLVQNNEREPYSRDAAIIELTPLDRTLDPGERNGSAIMVSSEPLSADGGWDAVPVNHLLRVEPDLGLSLEPVAA